ncbi:hypothetical protein PybrP1_002238 [[Pythium] brassicae (nom. inval.)]|nr:hypothetical protein PybrP1_002238 [[Pythium] brassicae (nom. inval.)]
MLRPRSGSAARSSGSRCEFQGHNLHNFQAPSETCGALCELLPGCSHWTWTPYLNGTCWLKSGETNRLYASSSVECGFLVARFRVDPSPGFDLGTGGGGPGAHGSASKSLSTSDADTFQRVLNFFRFAHNKSRLSLDARLVVAAKELAQECPPAQSAPRSAEKVASHPVAVRLGFLGSVYPVVFVAPSASTISEVITAMVNATHVASKPLLSSETTTIGFAARYNTTCAMTRMASSASDRATSAAVREGHTVVYTLLLA